MMIGFPVDTLFPLATDATANDLVLTRFSHPFDHYVVVWLMLCFSHFRARLFSNNKQNETF